jgi:hypothetical protein
VCNIYPLLPSLQLASVEELESAEAFHVLVFIIVIVEI